MPMFFPACILLIIDAAHLMPKRKAPLFSLELLLITFELYLSGPLGTALYPRMGKVSSDELEDEFKSIKDKNGEFISTFTYNKGL